MNSGDVVETALNGEYNEADSRMSSGTVHLCANNLSF